MVKSAMAGMVSNGMEIAAEKALLRRQSLQSRQSLDSDFRAQAAKTISHYADELDLGQSRMVAGYWPIRDELDPRLLMEVIRKMGRGIALPVVGDVEIHFREYDLNLPLVDAGYGTKGPDRSQPEVSPDALLIPLAAFDRFGGRIGYGKGYYDKAIAKLRQISNVKCIGIAFSVQEVEKVPMEAHDIHLPVILTENGLLTAKKG